MNTTTSAPVTPAARCVFAAYLAAALFSAALGALAAGACNTRLLTCALFAFAAAVLLRLHLHCAGEWQACIDEEDCPEETAPCARGATPTARTGRSAVHHCKKQR